MPACWVTISSLGHSSGSTNRSMPVSVSTSVGLRAIAPSECTTRRVASGRVTWSCVTTWQPATTSTAQRMAKQVTKTQEHDLDGHPGLLVMPADARALYVLAHGAGAGMRHAFMTAIAEALAARAI